MKNYNEYIMSGYDSRCIDDNDLTDFYYEISTSGQLLEHKYLSHQYLNRSFDVNTYLWNDRLYDLWEDRLGVPYKIIEYKKGVTYESQSN